MNFVFISALDASSKIIIMNTELLFILSSGILGIFTGAQLCEGVLLVPYWKSMTPKDFFTMHKTYGKKIYQFFAPLTILATLIPITTTIYSISTNSELNYFSLGMGFFTLLFFSTYFIYFKNTNKNFAEASITHEELPQELDRWSKWHWARIGLEFVAFACSLLALSQL